MIAARVETGVRMGTSPCTIVEASDRRDSHPSASRIRARRAGEVGIKVIALPRRERRLDRKG